MRILFSAVLAFFMSSSLMAHPFTINNLRPSGDCQGAQITVEEYKGEYFIKAFFDGTMSALTDGASKTFDKKRCTLNYDLAVAPGYKFDFFEFSVDGSYQTSERGVGRLTVSHRAGNAPAVRTTGFYARSNGDLPGGELLPGGFSGAINRDQLDGQYQNCGAQIPLETSVYATTNQPSDDRSSNTVIDLDESVSSGSATKFPAPVCQGYFCFCKIKVKRC